MFLNSLKLNIHSQKRFETFGTSRLPPIFKKRSGWLSVIKYYFVDDFIGGLA
jgi:hypothetical protein